MKAQHKTKRFVMYLSAFLVLIASGFILLTSFNLSSLVEGKELKQIEKIYYETVSYGISQDVDPSSIPDSRLSEIRPYSQTVTDKFTINAAFLASRSRTYSHPANNPDDWIKPYYKSVSDVTGTYLYDRDGTLVHHEDPANDIFETKDFSDTNLSNLGLYPILDMPDNNQLNSLYQAGYIFAPLNQHQYLYYNDTLEVFVDIEEQYYDIRVYDNGLISKRTFRDFERTPRNFNIPEVFVDETFESMGHGLFRQSNRKEFLAYIIDDEVLKMNTHTLNSQPKEDDTKTIVKDGFTLSQFNEDHHSVQFSVGPNPVTDYLTINLKGAPGQLGSITIYNMSGQAIEAIGEPSEKMEIKVDHLPSGLYLIEYRVGSVGHNTRFIKQ